MSTKRKACIISVVTALALCIALLAVVLITRNGHKKPDVPKLDVTDWSDEKETVVLGTCYEVPKVRATGPDGTEYPVEINVYRVSSGKKVPLILDCFDVIELKGYTIEYTAYTEEAKAVKQVSIDVIDEGNPVVCGSILAYTEVKKRYDYPDFHIVDDSNEIAKVNVDIYRVSTGEKVDSDEKGFTPQELGEYHMVVQAEDSSGNQSNQATFSVWASAIRNSDKWVALQSKVKQVRTGRRLVLSEIDNAADVFKDYTDKIIEIRSKYGLIDATKSGEFTPEQKGDYTVVYSFLDSEGKPVNGSYPLLVFDVEQAGTLWDTDSEAGLGSADGKIFSWLSKYDGEKGVIRWKGKGDNVWGWCFRNVLPMFDKAYYTGCDTLVFKVKTDDPDGMASILYFAEGHSYDLTNTAVTGDWTEVEIPLANLSNTTTACEGNFENFWERFVTNNSSMIYCSGRSSDDVSIYIADIWLVKKAAVESDVHFVSVGENVTLSDNAKTVLKGYSDVSCQILRPDGTKAAVKNGSFKADEQGSYTVIYRGFDAEDRVVRASYRISAYPEEYRGTLWNTDSETGLGNYSKKVFSWLPECDGEMGVIRWKGTGDDVWGWIFRDMKPLFAKEYYEGCNTLLVKVRTDDPDGAARLLYFAENQKYDLEIVNVTDNWTEVEIPLANKSSHAEACDGNFENFWEKFIVGNSSMIYCMDRSSDDVSIYITDIKLVQKKEVTSSVTMGNLGAELTLSDNSAEVFAGLDNLTRTVTGPDGKERNVTNGRFTPDKNGIYTVVYKANDRAGRMIYGSYLIRVYPAGMLWDTDSGLAAFGSYHAKLYEWLPEYDGEKGVIRWKGEGENVWGWIFRNTMPVFEKSYYEGSDTLVFKVKTDDPDGMAGLLYYAENQKYDLARITVTGNWTEVEIPLANKSTHAEACEGNFENFWEKFVTESSSMIYGMDRSSDDVSIYIADISLVKKATVNNQVHFTGVGEQVTISDDAATVFAGCSGISCQVLRPDGTKVPASDGGFRADMQGDYTVIYTGYNADGKYVRASYTISAYKEEYRGVLWNTDSAAALGGHASAIYSWMSEYDGETGVIRWKGEGDNIWGWIFRNRKPMFAKEYYEGCNTILMKVKTDDPDGAARLRYFAEGYNYDLDFVTVTDKWMEVEIPLTNTNGSPSCAGSFEDFWEKFIVGNSSMIYCVDRSSDDVSIYIADIKLVKKATVTSSITKGNTGVKLSLKDDRATVFAGMKDLSVSIVGPDGKKLTATDGTFTPDKNGTYTVTYRAVDAGGRIVYGSYGILVYPAGTLWDTDSAVGLGSHHSTIYSWMSEYDGEEGVIRWKGEGDNIWGWIFRNIKPIFDKSDYEGSNTILMKVKTDDPDGAARLRYFAEGYNYDLDFVTVTEAWMEVEIPFTNTNGSPSCAGSFEDFWEKFIVGNSSMIYCVDRSSDDVSIYIADIKLVKKVDLNSTITLGNTGKEVSLSDNSAEMFTGVENVSIEVIGPDGKNLTLADGKFIPEKIGTYTVVYKAVDPNGKVLYGSYPIRVYPAGTLWDTDSGVALLGEHSIAVSWLKSYDGQDGVICVNSGVWAHLFRGSRPVFDKSDYEGSDTLVFKVKTDDPDGSANFIYFAEGQAYDLNWTAITNSWTEIEIPLTNASSAAGACEGNFENFWQKFIENSTSMIFCGDASSTDVKMYIADIRLVNKAAFHAEATNAKVVNTKAPASEATVKKETGALVPAVKPCLSLLVDKKGRHWVKNERSI